MERKTKKIATKKVDKRAQCINEVRELLSNQGIYSPELDIQVEIVGGDLFLYRKMMDEAKQCDIMTMTERGVGVNPVLEQIRKQSDNLRKGLASLQMNKEKVTAATAKKEATTANQNRITKLVDKINEIK